MCARRLFALLLVLCALPAAAFASSAVRTVSQQDVLAQSDAVLVVSLAEPPTVEVRIPITPAGEKPDPKRWPDFVRRDRSLKVHEVLWLKEGATPSGTLQVTPGEWSTRLTVHRRYHVEGVRKIPIFQRYEGREGLTDLHRGDGKAIAFVRREPETGWRMAAEMAFAGIGEKKRLARWFKKNKTGRKANPLKPAKR